MNWKYEAIDKLKVYEAHRKALENIPRELRRLEEAFVGIRSAATDGTPVVGGGNSREDSLLSNVTHREELARTRRQAEAWVEMVESGLGVLDDDERLVLDRFYIHRSKGNVDRLCQELCLEKTAIYERREKALRHFTIALYGITET